MSSPANPYDHASCESFSKTLKREEIYANKYGNMEQLRANIDGAFCEQREPQEEILKAWWGKGKNQPARAGVAVDSRVPAMGSQRVCRRQRLSPRIRRFRTASCLQARIGEPDG